MRLNVVLLENVRNYGGTGEIVSVRGGYGRYLVDIGRALFATAKNIVNVAENLAEIKRKLEEKTGKFRNIADKITELGGLLIGKNSNDIGRLYGSVSTADIVKLLEEHDVKIQANHIRKPSIDAVGEYTIVVQFDGGVESQFQLKVERYVDEATAAMEAAIKKDESDEDSEVEAMLAEDERKERTAKPKRSSNK
jgi:large subunit ribosomal protein L9